MFRLHIIFIPLKLVLSILEFYLLCFKFGQSLIAFVFITCFKAAIWFSQTFSFQILSSSFWTWYSVTPSIASKTAGQKYFSLISPITKSVSLCFTRWPSWKFHFTICPAMMLCTVWGQVGRRECRYCLLPWMFCCQGKEHHSKSIKPMLIIHRANVLPALGVCNARRLYSPILWNDVFNFIPVLYLA